MLLGKKLGHARVREKGFVFGEEGEREGGEFERGEKAMDANG